MNDIDALWGKLDEYEKRITELERRLGVVTPELVRTRKEGHITTLLDLTVWNGDKK